MNNTDAFLNQIKSNFESFLEYLEANDLEINDEGDIVEKKGKKLLLQMSYGVDEDE